MDHVVDRLGNKVGRLLGKVEPKRLEPGGVQLPTIRVPGDELRYLVTGDTGTGDKNQMKVAAAMTADALMRKPHFSVNLGDLVYENGVKRADDPLLRERLDVPYEKLGGKMYLMAGNHDHRGDVGAIIEHAKSSPVVEMPARYYGFSYEFGKRKADFFVLDTEVLEDDPAQLAWLTAAFRASKADYKIVLGHHNIDSGGKHGASDVMRSLVLPLIDGKAQLAAGGHDHDQQVLSTPGGTLLLVSGAGGKSRPTGRTDNTHFAHEGLGYAAITLGQKGLSLELLDADRRCVLHRESLPLGEKAKRPTAEPAGQLPWAGAAHSRFKTPDRSLQPRS